MVGVDEGKKIWVVGLGRACGLWGFVESERMGSSMLWVTKDV